MITTWVTAIAASVRAGDTVRIRGIYRDRTIHATDVTHAPGKPVIITTPAGRITRLAPCARAAIRCEPGRYNRDTSP